jgi:hypothetical protein
LEEFESVLKNSLSVEEVKFDQQIESALEYVEHLLCAVYVLKKVVGIY